MHVVRKLSISAAIGCAAFILAGCPNSSQVLLPPPGAASQQVYVGTFTQKTVLIFNLPLTASSVASGSFGASNTPGGMCFDASGRLFVGSWAGSPILVFNQPLTSSSTSTFSLTPTLTAEDCAFDAAGNLYVVDNHNGTVDVFTPPVQAGSTVHSHVAVPSKPFGVGTDAAGDVFVMGFANIYEFSPFGSGNTLTATFGIGDGFAAVIGPDSNLYASGGSASNAIDVYLPSQFHNGTTTPDHSITLSGVNFVFFLAFDSAKNLYAAAQLTGGTTNAVYVLAPPYTGAPTIVNTGATKAFGIAVRP